VNLHCCSAFVQFEFFDLGHTIIRAGMAFAIPASPLFVAGLAVAILSIAPANAEKNQDSQDT
jgi:hypothetical protein